jgi:hypothetical protein
MYIFCMTICGEFDHETTFFNCLNLVGTPRVMFTRVIVHKFRRLMFAFRMKDISPSDHFKIHVGSTSNSRQKNILLKVLNKGHK